MFTTWRTVRPSETFFYLFSGPSSREIARKRMRKKEMKRSFRGRRSIWRTVRPTDERNEPTHVMLVFSSANLKSNPQVYCGFACDILTRKNSTIFFYKSFISLVVLSSAIPSEIVGMINATIKNHCWLWNMITGRKVVAKICSQ